MREYADLLVLQSMASYDKEEHFCVKCSGPSSKGNLLSLVRAPKSKRKGGCEKDPQEKLIEKTDRLKLDELTRILMNNNTTQEPTYLHSSCKTYMNNRIRAKRTSDAQDEQVSAKRIAPENVSSSTQSTEENIDFRKQCFYFTKVCEYDDKHPYRNGFKYV